MSDSENEEMVQKRGLCAGLEVTGTESKLILPSGVHGARYYLGVQGVWCYLRVQGFIGGSGVI